MLRIYLALACLAAFKYQTCCGDTDDWRRQGFYRPRRNYPIQSDNENSFRSSQSTFSPQFDQISTRTTFKQNSERQNPFEINYNQNSKTQSVFASYNQPQNSFGFGSQNFKSLEPTKTSSQQASFGSSYQSQNQHSVSIINTQDTINKNAFGRNGQNSFKTSYSQTPSSQDSFSSKFSQNSFASSFSQNPTGNNGQNSFESSFGGPQNTQKQNAFESSYNKAQNTFGNVGQFQSSFRNKSSFQNQNTTSSTISNFGLNSAFAKNENRAPDYLPPKRFMAPEYLPPEKPRTTTFPPYVPPRTTTTTRRPFYTTTTTRRPFYTTTRQPSSTTTTRRPFFTTTTTKRPYFTITTTKRPFYTTTTTKRPFYTKSTTTRPTFTPHYLPAMASQVPPEPEADVGSDITPDDIRTLLFLTGQVHKAAPALAMKVPPEPEDDGSDITPGVIGIITNQVSPAMAVKVPPEPEDDGAEIIDDFPSTTTSTTTTPSTTIPTTTTPSTTTSTTPSTTTSTTLTTTTSTPPPTTISTTTTTSTTPPTTTSTPPPTTTTTSTKPPTTTSTPPPTTTTTSTTPPTTISTTPPTTTSTPPPTTTSTRPPTTTTTTPSTTTSTATPSTMTPDPNRILTDEVPTTTPKIETTFRTTSTPVIPSTEPYKAPDYLPPKIVSPEAECDPLDPSTYPFGIDHRNIGSNNPCEPIPTTTTIKPPFRGPLYLPPEPKTRVGRSSNSTLKLADLKGTPRPVWYAGIYKKTTNPYKPICGGSIIREDVVISAAHCFWDDSVGKQAAKLFAVAARKIYKPWTDTMDKRAQKSDVLDIKIPPRFLGAKTSFQEDLAILKLTTPFTYNQGLKPICVDFDDDFDRQQMKAGHLGTIAGWGYTDANGTPAVRLLWLELPYVEIEKCIRDSVDDFLKYITCDKVCAGENDSGKALCRGDSGGGLAFWQGEPGHATPYLRGIASTAPSADAQCNVFAYASFTHVNAHRTFLRDHVPDIENCRFWG